MGGKPADSVGGEAPACRRSSGGARFDIWVFVDGGPWGEGPPCFGAQRETRTPTALRPLPPQSSASTNSAIWAGHAKV